MIKRKFLLKSILVASSIVLSSCSLFNDDNLSFTNSYNTPTTSSTTTSADISAGGVGGKIIDAVPQAYCFKNIPYGINETIPNTYGESGINHKIYNVNDDEDYFASKTSNNYDLYVPHSAPKNDEHVVMLFIHGGAWVSGFKTDVNAYVYEFANRGYITATVKYTLLKRSMNDPALSIFRNLDEIDACIKSIKLVLNELHFDTAKTKLVIGGVSSGAHLSMLYAYSRGENSPLPIEFIIDITGPVDIKTEVWKYYMRNEGDEDEYNDFLDQKLTPESIQNANANNKLSTLWVADDGMPYTWNEYQTMRIANGMCGVPFSSEEIAASTDEKMEAIVYPNEASNSLTSIGGGEDLLSTTYWIKNTSNTYPVVCAYAGMDTIIGIAQYAALKTSLDNKGIENSYFYFRDCEHGSISRETGGQIFEDFINKIDDLANSIA